MSTLTTTCIFLLNINEEIFFKGFTWQTALYLLILCILLFCSAMASASETALFSLQPNDINELKTSSRKSEKAVLEIRQNPKRLLATILITNNLVNVTITIFSTYIMAMMFNESANMVLAFIINVVVVTSLVLIFGEMIPKIYATKRPKALAISMAKVLKILIVIFKPLSSILVNSTSFIDKKLAKKSKGLSFSDLSTAVEITTDDTPLEEKNMLKGIATFSEKEVSEIMRPRVELAAVPYETDFNTLIKFIIDNGFSRIPVYKDTLDEIAGIIYVKDLVPNVGNSNFQWQKLIRSAYFIPENMKINDLFQSFRTKKIHIAIVVDEYGGTSGLVTMEDVLEEIVGDISDEFDNIGEEDYYTVSDENTYLFKGQTSIVDFCKVFGISDNYFDEIKGESDTLAGMILEIEGRIPETGCTTEYKNFKFEITKVDTRRIIQIKVTYNENNSQTE